MESSSTEDSLRMVRPSYLFSTLLPRLFSLTAFLIQSFPITLPSSSSSDLQRAPLSRLFVLTSTHASSESSPAPFSPDLTFVLWFLSVLYRRGAALATSTTLHLTAAPAHLDQRNNSSMSMAYKQIMSDCFKQDIVIVGSSDGGAGGGSFSTDFGNGEVPSALSSFSSLSLPLTVPFPSRSLLSNLRCPIYGIQLRHPNRR